jgi:peptidoglycan/xylan/chitin deacetylase (PgdA/CDA1 family)
MVTRMPRRTFRLTLIGILIGLALVVAQPERPLLAGFTVYFTFDDGPYPGRTEKILDVLKKYDVKATFFVNGARIARNPATYTIVQRVLQEGHKLGNHNWAHIPELMYLNKPKPEKVMEGYATTEMWIQRALGPALWQQYNSAPRVYRWPGGSIWPLSDSAVYSYNWHISAGSDPTWKQEINNVLYGVPQAHTYGVYAWGDGAIILFHDQFLANPAALPPIIENLRKHGASFGLLPRPGDQPGQLTVALDALPPCAHTPENCAKENSGGVQ